MTSSHFTRPASRLLLLLAFGALGVCLATPEARAQSSQPPLADLAKKEAERRKTVKDSKKVITAKDLPESARRPATPPPSSESGAPGSPSAAGEQKPAAAGASTSPSAEAPDKGETYWRNRVTQAREALRRNEVFLEALQSRVNGLTTDFVNRDDPYQRAKIGEDRIKALEEMERVKAEIEGAKKLIGDVEEEARKAGVPPGWLR
jgi:hypothetical protein